MIGGRAKGPICIQAQCQNEGPGAKEGEISWDPIFSNLAPTCFPCGMLGAAASHMHLVQECIHEIH